MNQQNPHSTTGPYTANLLGNIRSHLAGLQGYDVMALELIQNADDAKAESVVFDITDRGLLVINSGKFTYCGDLHTRPCSFIASNNYSCDYHRIADVGSGGKLSRGENIGRFGIGFVSTYQVTDHPEIRSSGVKLTLHPEEGQWLIEPFEQPEGTTFFLPWADDPNTKARLALGVSHVSAAHIDQLVDDFQKVLRKSLLFLRHVRTAEVKRNGELLLACDLDRGDGSDLIVSFRPSGEVELWHILRADVAEAAARLYASHPRLEPLGRGTKISIGLRIDPEPLAEGLLYAFLPTEQSTGLPLHINADFFPESDRKAVIFAGHQHEQAWNEMLIDAAAAELARDPEGLLKMLGNISFWQIMARIFDLSRQSNHPTCFKKFWDRMLVTASQARIAPAQDGDVHIPSGVFFPDKTLNPAQASVLKEVGGQVITEDLRPFRTVVNQLGTPFLTFERLVGLLEQGLSPQAAGILLLQVEEDRLEGFYRPLWGMINELFPEAVAPPPATKAAIQQLQAIPFVVTEDLYAVTISQSFVAPATLEARRVASLLPRLAIASRHILGFPKIARQIRQLELGAVVSHLRSMCATNAIEDVIGVEQEELRDLYAMFAELDRHANVDAAVYQSLRNLPIWLSSRGLIKASQALLPGNFTDPTGQADLLEASVLTASAREFVSSKLGVPTQTIEAFVQNVLPRCFNHQEPTLHIEKYKILISELAKHPSLLDNAEILKQIQALPILPTQDGRWGQPTNIYRREDELVRVLGDATSLWLDTNRVPNTLSVYSLINNLGLLKSPSATHLVERMHFIAKNELPTEDAKRASSEAFYALCDRYEEWKEKPFFQNTIRDLRRVACFPAEGEKNIWHVSTALHAPYRIEAFNRSQAKVLDFRSMKHLKAPLLEALGIALEPKTELLIEHLHICMKEVHQPHSLTYQMLNERAQRDDPQITTLRNSACIYNGSKKAFIRPNQVYWTAPQLGRYVFTIPERQKVYKDLFNALGVKDAPDGKDYIAILLDLVNEYHSASNVVKGADLAIYEACLRSVAESYQREEIREEDIQTLQNEPTILNILGEANYPYDVLLHDSEWHATFFNGDLEGTLCKPAPELWEFIEKIIGVRRLSKSAKVMLNLIDGLNRDEPDLTEKLAERIDILARVLHDKPTAIKEKVRTELLKLTTISVDLLRVQSSVRVIGDGDNNPTRLSEPKSAEAFYDIDKHQLIVKRPVDSKSWRCILNAIFHQLMQEETGNAIRDLTAIAGPRMEMSVEDAHQDLTAYDFPQLDAEEESRPADDLTSPSLDEIGSVTDTNQDPREEKADSILNKPFNNEEQANIPQINQPVNKTKTAPSDKTENQQKKTQTQNNEKRERSKRRLSYMGSSDTNSREHNLAVEDTSRAAVCTYEKDRGRITEEMPQNNAGYDIISTSPTGEKRYIEVKGINQEWDQKGVGLSRTQFIYAQQYPDNYWLYVVEFVSDPQRICVHPIFSPATQVKSFMFDDSWRDAVTQEPKDLYAFFVPGVRIHHKTMGNGMIKHVVTRNKQRYLTVLFDEKPQETSNVTLDKNISII